MTQAQQLKNLFELFPGKEFGLPELAQAIGAYAVHSRVAELRTKCGTVIVNRIEKKDRKKHSFYRYCPADLTQGREDAKTDRAIDNRQSTIEK